MRTLSLIQWQLGSFKTKVFKDILGFEPNAMATMQFFGRRLTMDELKEKINPHIPVMKERVRNLVNIELERRRKYPPKPLPLP